MKCKAYCKGGGKCLMSATWGNYCLTHYNMYNKDPNKWFDEQERLKMEYKENGKKERNK